MKSYLKDKDWDTLLWRIDEGKCTPFLGAGACYGVLPLGAEIAQKWAKEEGYPLSDCDDLARVAQFLAVDRQDPMFPKEKIVRLFKDVASPDFSKSDEPHSVMADLPLPIYITTNYDDFMMQALKSRNKDPKLEICRWNKYIKDQSSILKSKGGFEPTPANPVVFHLHGYQGVPESLVLTEDDYLDFLVNISRDRLALIPNRIQRAMAGASLLFIGYRLADLSFRVLFRGLVGSLEESLRRINVAVQLPPTDSEPEYQQVQDYLTKYFKNTDVLVYWGTAKKFVTDLRDRWEKFCRKKEDSKNET
ncbi:hypothetical protein ES703_95169 [subsurface metagenome]